MSPTIISHRWDLCLISRPSLLPALTKEGGTEERPMWQKTESGFPPTANKDLSLTNNRVCLEIIPSLV